MKLLTDEVLKAFQKQGKCDEKPANEVRVIAKFFNPCGAGTWYATEYNPEDKCFFGYVNLIGKDCAELGYFSLDELEGLKLPFGLGIERDLHFGEHTLEEVMNSDRRL
jgi:hypothetical protein